MPVKQDSRFIAIKTPLGADALGLRSMLVQEQLSRLFQIEVELSSENGEIDLDKVVGHDVTIRMNLGQKDKRFFHGFVSRMVQEANQGGYAHYRASIVPWLWFLTRTSDCRAWIAAENPDKGKTVPEVIEAVFKAQGFNDYKLSLTGNYPKREFCVQYRETDFNFVSRLMEQEGIYYYFEHEDGKHTLVLADSISAHKPFPGYEEVTFHELEQGADREVITDWTIEKEVQPVASALQDFDFKKPKTSLLASTSVNRKYGKAQFEIYDYPGEYLEHGDGQRLADARLEELQTQYETLHGQATARGLAGGHTFTLKKHARTDQNREYLITGVSLHADAGEFATSGGDSEPEHFSCSFMAIGKTQQFRPARLTPKPVVQGLQTAIVVGPSGEEIHTEEQARVKVQFHWDRYGKYDENSSCWVRVSQPWAGKNWGGLYIPHVGHEVVVSFEEGDPDRPLITGRVYNANEMPPVALPANKTQSAMSDYGGNQTIVEGKDGAQSIHTKQKCGNEFLMDGTSGSEKIQLKDKYGNEICLDAVKGTLRLYSPTHKTEQILGKCFHFFTEEDWDVECIGKEALKIHGPRHDNVLGLESKFIGGVKQETVVGADIKLMKAKRLEKVSGEVLCEDPDYFHKSKTSILQTEEDFTILSGEDSMVKVAPDSIALVCGESGLKLEKGGTITIYGKKIVITGDDDAAIQTNKLTLSAKNHEVEIGKENHS